MAYLDDHPPKRYQFRKRRKRPTGCIVVHSAENLPDVNPPDTGAENVAGFIRDRSDAGSYHDLSDSDSTIHLVRYEMAAFGDGTGSNEFATHVSGAFRAGQWTGLSHSWRSGCVRQMAQAARRQADWVKNETGIEVPAKLITRQESELGWPGFISHAKRDPARRSDPGQWFWWDEFFEEFRVGKSAANEEWPDVSASIIELMKREYRKRRGPDYEPAVSDPQGWEFWMRKLATGTDVNGNKADDWTIFQGFLWIITANEGEGKYG